MQLQDAFLAADLDEADLMFLCKCTMLMCMYMCMCSRRGGRRRRVCMDEADRASKEGGIWNVSRSVVATIS